MKAINEMTNAEIMAEVDSYPELTDRERAALEDELRLRA
jgi:hypothetical protein